MVSHSRIPPWDNLMDRGACMLQSTGPQRVRHDPAAEQQQYLGMEENWSPSVSSSSTQVERTTMAFFFFFKEEWTTYWKLCARYWGFLMAEKGTLSHQQLWCGLVPLELEDQRKKGEITKVWKFIFSGFKITADSDCSHEIKRCFLLGRKAMTNLDSLLKNRDIILPKKVPKLKVMVFPVVMYRCQNWTIKKD